MHQEGRRKSEERSKIGARVRYGNVEESGAGACAVHTTLAFSGLLQRPSVRFVASEPRAM